MLNLGESRIFGVSLREHWARRTPVDGESRIVPKNAVFVGLAIVITAFVKKLNSFRHGQKAVGKTSWDIDLVMFLGGEMDAGPFAKVRRANADVHGNVYGFAFDDPAELGLGMLQL